MVAVPHKMFGLERVLEYRGVRSQEFHCMKSTIDSVRIGYLQNWLFSNIKNFCYSMFDYMLQSILILVECLHSNQL